MSKPSAPKERKSVADKKQGTCKTREKVLPMHEIGA